MRRLPLVATARASAALVVMIPVALTTALAISEPSPPKRFDDHVQAREGGAIAVEPRAIERLNPSDPLRAGWEEFKSRHEGAWKVYLDERTGMPTMVSGRGIEWFSEGARAAVGLEHVVKRARAFLDENRTMLEVDLEASTKLHGDHWQLVFRQAVDGVRVENARLDLHVKRGRLALFGTSHWGIPTTNGVPSIDANEARAILDAHVGTATALFVQVEEPELTIVAIDPTPASAAQHAWTGPRGEGLKHVLIWRFQFRVPGEAPLWVGEVDAHDGSIRAFFDGAHYANVNGGVFPISNDGDCSTGGCEIARFPMPFADYTESGQPETFADAFGNLSCSNSVSSFETNLIGPYVRINDSCGELVESGTCDAGVDLGLKHGENCDVKPGASNGNSAAARSTYYHVNRAAEVARFYDPGNTWLQDQVTVNVNVGSTCNAFWNGEITMYGSGNGCGNTGELQGVLVHEWGHGYDQNDGGGMDITSEAYADVVAIFAARDSCVSRGWYNDGSTCTGYGDTCLTCTGIRDHDWAARSFGTPATPAGFVMTQCPGGPGGPCGQESHCEAYPPGEAIYDLATRDLPAAGLDPDTAWQLAERLWYVTRPGSGGHIYVCLRGFANSCGATSWYQRMRVADDDDGDLSNGTPHAAALFAAFARHGIACGAEEDPENQSTSSCPSLATPQLTVIETGSSTELSWNAIAEADEYRVYRGDLGCDRQQVPIASLTGAETIFVDTVADPGLPRYYRVEAFGANPACHSPVSNCESTPAGARLQKNSHRIIEAGPDINDIPDPGETVTLPVTLFNSGLDDAFGIAGTLRFVDPAQGQVLDPDANWADIASGEMLESSDPHFEVAVSESVTCGDSLMFEFDMSASNAATRTERFQIPLGEPARDFRTDVSVTIPPETSGPVTSTLAIDQDKTLSDLDVSITINHNLVTELIVELTSPEGTTVRLHDRTDPGGFAGLNTRYDLESTPDGPGTMADFAGESTLGTWTLSVEDVGPDSTGDGSIEAWTLHTTVSDGFDCLPVACTEPPPTEAVGNFHVETSVNGSQVDLVFSWDPVTAAAGYLVLQSTVPSFDTGVNSTGSTSGETSLTVPDGVNATPGLTFFQVRAVNSCDVEGP